MVQWISCKHQRPGAGPQDVSSYQFKFWSLSFELILRCRAQSVSLWLPRRSDSAGYPLNPSPLLPPISTREHAERSPYEPACDECYIAPNPPTACPPASSRDDGATDAAAPADAAAVRAAELAAAARLQLDQQQLDQQQLRQDKLDLEAVVAAASKASFEAAAAIATLEPHNPARAVDDSATRVGLNNPKAVCHLNALLQCLFMDVEFRRGIYGHADRTLVNSSVAVFEADVDGGCGQPAAKVLAAAATAADSVSSMSPSCASGKDS